MGAIQNYLIKIKPLNNYKTNLVRKNQKIAKKYHKIGPKNGPFLYYHLLIF